MHRFIRFSFNVPLKRMPIKRFYVFESNIIRKPRCYEETMKRMNDRKKLKNNLSNFEIKSPELETEKTPEIKLPELETEKTLEIKLPQNDTPKVEKKLDTLQSDKSNINTSKNMAEHFYQVDLVANLFTMVSCCYCTNQIRPDYYTLYRWGPSRDFCFDFYDKANVLKNVEINVIELKSMSYYREKIGHLDKHQLRQLLYKLSLYIPNYKYHNHILDHVKLVIQYFENNIAK